MLKTHGVRSYTVHTVGLKLSSEGRPIPLGQLTLHSPELVVRGAAGSVAATVTMGARSGSYLVLVPGGGEPQTLREPQQVANLILAARLGGRS
ncbi:hypothetical protein ABT352_13025 [Streptosporangium sp. NPDC000563]|uniref:hypothetical protein n=1 Tax=Streptosporangium sp. NPDC000563 TaxID=3154366 RepID=UPI0033290D62